MIASAPGFAGHRLAARFADGPHVCAPIQAELVCGGNQGPRQVQRGDPDQARTGSRGRYAGARRIVPVAEKSRGCPVSLVREYGRTAASGERRHHP
jgi:hypothetical protein